MKGRLQRRLQRWRWDLTKWPRFQIMSIPTADLYPDFVLFVHVNWTINVFFMILFLALMVLYLNKKVQQSIYKIHHYKQDRFQLMRLCVSIIVFKDHQTNLWVCVFILTNKEPDKHDIPASCISNHTMLMQSMQIPGKIPDTWYKWPKKYRYMYTGIYKKLMNTVQ